MTLRWMLLIAIEIYAWAGTAVAVVLRYRHGRTRASNRLLVSILAVEAGLLVLGVVDWVRSGEWTPYQTVILAILAYAAGWGKRDLRRLDAWMARRGTATSGRATCARCVGTRTDAGPRRPRRSRRAAARAVSPGGGGFVEASARPSLPHRNACSCP